MESNVAVVFQSRDQNPDTVTNDTDVPLTDNSWYETARKLRQDPTLALARAIMTAPIVKTPWRVEGSDDKAVELIKKTILPLQSVLMREATNSCADYGWHSWEVRPQTIDGTRYLRHKNLRHEITTPLVDKDGFPVGVANTGYLKDTYIFAEAKKIYQPYVSFAAANEEYGNIYGEPLLKKAQPICERYDKVEAASERFNTKIAGAHWKIWFPIGQREYKGKTVSTEEIVKDVAAGLQSSGIVSLPVSASKAQELMEGGRTSLDVRSSGWDVELIESSKSNDPFLERQRYYDALKLRAMLVPERTALEGHFGTKADSSEHADMAMLAIEQWGQGVMNWFNSPWGIVASVLRFNNIKYYPGVAKLVQLPLADDDKAFMREIIRTMINGDARYARTIDLAQLSDRTNVPVNGTTIEEIIEKDRDYAEQLSKQNSGGKLENNSVGNPSSNPGGSSGTKPADK